MTASPERVGHRAAARRSPRALTPGDPRVSVRSHPTGGDRRGGRCRQGRGSGVFRTDFGRLPSGPGQFAIQGRGPARKTRQRRNRLPRMLIKPHRSCHRRDPLVHGLHSWNQGSSPPECCAAAGRLERRTLGLDTVGERGGPMEGRGGPVRCRRWLRPPTRLDRDRSVVGGGSLRRSDPVRIRRSIPSGDGARQAPVNRPRVEPTDPACRFDASQPPR